MSDELSNATRIAALEEQVRQLTGEVAALTDLAEQRRNRAKEAEHALANARAWIDGQDVLSDFPNATAMRQALDRERDDHANTTRALHNISKWVHGEDFRAEYPTATAMRNALITERERCFVLEREVLKWRYAEYISRAIENAAYLDTERHELNAARDETDTRHALDAAKFVGGGQ